MTSVDYQFPENLWKSDLAAKLLSASETVVRLDERLRRSSPALAQGWVQRSLFGEACACQLTEGDLVHLEDLVLFDAHTFTGTANIPLGAAHQILTAWRAGLVEEPSWLLFRTERPGLMDPEPCMTALADAEESKPDWTRRDAWRRILRQIEKLPPLLAAAIAWDAWLELVPEDRGGWRAPLLAALVLRWRGTTTGWLLPIDSGRRFAPYRRHDAHNRTAVLTGFLDWCQTSAMRGMEQLNRLETASALLRLRLEGRRRNSRLGDLIDFLLARPLVSKPMAANALGISLQAVEKLWPLLGSTPREITGRQRFRAWMVG